MRRDIILVVEDNKITRKMFRAALESQGWKVLEAPDGASALELAAREKPGIIIQDLTLPDMDGLDLLKRLLALPGAADVPVIALSGFLSKLEQARSLEVGFVEHLFKPVDPYRLIEAVRGHMRQASSSDAPGSGRRIVVADDDAVQCRLLKLQLEQVGFSVTTASGGQEALEKAIASRPDVIVSDVLMPGLDGFRLCLAVRQDPRLAGVPVVLVSAAFGDDADRQLAKSVGANDLVVRSPEHHSVIEAVIASLRAGVSPPATGLELPTDVYTHRMIRQLERQVGHNADLAGRLALHEAAMGVLVRIGEMARKPGSIETLIPDLLHNALDAAGISVGAVFLVQDEGGFALSAQHGFSSPRASLEGFFGRADLLRQAMESRTSLHVPAVHDETPAESDLLEKAGARALLLMPLQLGEQKFGVLVLAAARRRLATEWLPFAEAIGVQIAQAVALARAVTQIGQEHERFRKTEDQLRHVQKMEAVGRLAGGVAHDFNNLLTAINGYSDLLLGQVAPGAPLRKELQEIRRAGERATTLTRQLLAFSRKQVLQPKVLDLNTVVGGMDSMLRRILGADVDLRTTLDPAIGRVKADPGQIEQVVVNLAVNARDAMPGGGKLTIETSDVVLDETYVKDRTDVRPGAHVLVAVSDTGTGMDKETLSHLFEPFFTTKALGKGTGLGLSMVYGIVKQSGGHVAVYSEPGQGTAFKVYLPRVEDAPDPVQATGSHALSPRGSETVLLVEDDEMVRMFVQEVLSMNGYKVLVAGDGKDAISLCEKHPQAIHLLLTDVVLPQVSGRQLWERLTPLRRGMKVLYMSGYTDNAIVHSGVLDRGTAFIQKPFTPGALAREVRSVLDSPPA